MQSLRWDIFCRVIDNFGDIGACWRLSNALAARGQTVRLWVDDASALTWMAQGDGADVEVKQWLPDQAMLRDVQPGDVVIEAFGCEVDHTWITMNSVALSADSMPASSPKDLKNPVWINLEYLSAEKFAERSHGLPSPVMTGPAAGRQKWFFYPGFTSDTGGLMRESDATMDASLSEQLSRISLFCYEPTALETLVAQLATRDEPTELLVMEGRGQKALESVMKKKNAQWPAWNLRKALSIHEQSWMPQTQYDALLRSCDLNFVRGEDSLVRALWAGRAFVWQIYPQQDNAHAAKLEAFLDWLQAPQDLREFHRVWNGLKQAMLPSINILGWQACAQAAQKRLLTQRDLVSQLLDFVEEKRNAPV